MTDGTGIDALRESLPEAQRGGTDAEVAAAGARRIRDLEAYAAELEKRAPFSRGEFHRIVGEYAAAIRELEAGPAGDVRTVLEEVRDHLRENLETPGELESEGSVYERVLADRIDAVLALRLAMGEPFKALYRNWKGETAVRTIIPGRLWHGATDWHAEPQWLMTGWDCDRQAFRDFALGDFLGSPK